MFSCLSVTVSRKNLCDSRCWCRCVAASAGPRGALAGRPPVPQARPPVPRAHRLQHVAQGLLVNHTSTRPQKMHGRELWLHLSSTFSGVCLANSCCFRAPLRTLPRWPRSRTCRNSPIKTRRVVFSRLVDCRLPLAGQLSTRYAAVACCPVAACLPGPCAEKGTPREGAGLRKCRRSRHRGAGERRR